VEDCLDRRHRVGACSGLGQRACRVKFSSSSEQRTAGVSAGRGANAVSYHARPFGIAEHTSFTVTNAVTVINPIAEPVADARRAAPGACRSMRRSPEPLGLQLLRR